MASKRVLDRTIDRLAVRSRLLRFKLLNRWRSDGISRRQASFTPRDIPPVGWDMLRAVREQGVGLLPGIAALLGPASGAIVDDLVRRGSGAWHWPAEGLLESEDIYTLAPEVYRLGLEPGLLDLAENYLAEPCFYMGCSMKREGVTSSMAGTRQWHLDIEDDRMLRVIMYLNDVELGGGTFSYIDRAASAMARSRLNYASGYVPDTQMRVVADESSWNRVLAPAGGVLAFDGTKIFHRVERPTARERFSLSLTYSTRHPRQVMRVVRLQQQSRRDLLASLSERQRACIPSPRYL